MLTLRLTAINQINHFRMR